VETEIGVWMSNCVATLPKAQWQEALLFNIGSVTVVNKKHNHKL
jgi:hypothetical protein